MYKRRYSVSITAILYCTVLWVHVLQLCPGRLIFVVTGVPVQYTTDTQAVQPCSAAREGRELARDSVFLLTAGGVLRQTLEPIEKPQPGTLTRLPRPSQASQCPSFHKHPSGLITHPCPSTSITSTTSNGHATHDGQRPTI